MAAGLVDTLVYTQDMDSLLRVYTGTQDYNMLNTSKLALVKRPASKAKDKVAVLYLEGAITDDNGDGIVGKDVVKTIKKIRKDKNVKALVLRVNSPGGSADASEQIWHAIQNVKADSIPVVVSMGDYAASGGYYISCGADYIFAEPTTLTGCSRRRPWTKSVSVSRLRCVTEAISTSRNRCWSTRLTVR